jgi:uncharacterized membrane protein
MALRTYRGRLRAFGLLAVGAALAAGIAGGRIARLGPPGENFWLVFPALVVVCALAFAACIPWWRKMDHMQREGQLVSWYWGGLGAATLVLMALVAGAGVKSDLAQGAMYMVLGQAAGFFAYWVAWQWAHRGEQS